MIVAVHLAALVATLVPQRRIGPAAAVRGVQVVAAIAAIGQPLGRPLRPPLMVVQPRPAKVLAVRFRQHAAVEVRLSWSCGKRPMDVVSASIASMPRFQPYSWTSFKRRTGDRRLVPRVARIDARAVPGHVDLGPQQPVEVPFLRRHPACGQLPGLGQIAAGLGAQDAVPIAPQVLRERRTVAAGLEVRPVPHGGRLDPAIGLPVG